MRVKIQVVIEPAGEKPTTTEVATIDRAELDAGSLGLHLSEAKAILKGMQETIVASQVEEFVREARLCSACNVELSHKGHHDMVYRTVFGKLRLGSPRLYRCPGCSGGRRSFSPLAERLPERSSPELQYLQTKFSALMSFGLTVAVLREVLPLKGVLAGTSVRRWMTGTSRRIEADLKDDSVCKASEFKIPRPYIPEPSPVKAIGIDGGYVRLAGHKSRSDGWFEVIVGKSQRTDGRGACFAYVHRLEPDPGRRMERFLTHEGIRPDQPVTFLSDGGDTVRQAQFGPRAFGEWILDWFHISMRFQNLTQIAKGLPGSDQLPGREEVLRGVEGAKWHLWHGCWYRAIRRLESLTFKVSALGSSETTRKLQGKLSECINYINKNKEFIVDYADRHRYGDPIATGFVESAVNQVVSKRMVKKQQMSWSAANADSVLQVRTTVLNEELRRHFKRWYPSLAATDHRTGQHAA